MNKIFFLLIFFSTPLIALENESQTLCLMIKGMSCSNCSDKIKTQLQKDNGVINAKISAREAEGVITFNSSLTSVQKIKKSIADTGYEGAEIPCPK